MVIKSISWKTPGFQRILEYVTQEFKTAGIPITRNLLVRDSTDLVSVRRAFQKNARYLPPRKKGVFFYHEILSFSPADSPHLTPEILTDLAVRYLELRADEALAYGTIHLDRGHFHVHLVISSNPIRQKKKLRLSRPQFAGVKRAMEAYQKERYPELRHSIVFEERPEFPRRSVSVESGTAPAAVLPPGGTRAAERARRFSGEGREAPSPRELLHRELLRALTCAASWEEFRRRLQAAGITVYYRGGRPYGVIRDGHKYRFKTLGLTVALAVAEEKWQQLPARRQALAQDRLTRTRSLVRRFGYASDMLELIEGEPADPAHRTLRQDRRERRHRQRERDFCSLSRDGPAPDRSP